MEIGQVDCLVIKRLEKLTNQKSTKIDK